MIQSLYVIDNGMCIFKHNFSRDVTSDIDEQLLSGFLNALGLFAEKTFQKGLQSIQIKDGIKLSFFLQKMDNLVFCVTSDELDDQKLLEKIVKKISEEFSNSMHDVLNSDRRSQLDCYYGFGERLKNIMRFKGRVRSPLTFIGGIATSLIFLILSAIPFLEYILPWMLTIFGEDNFLPVFIYLGSILLISGIISGYFAGNTKLGIINSLITFILYVIVIYFVIRPLYNLIIILLPFNLIISSLSGHLGGIICGRRKLYKKKVLKTRKT